MAFETFTTTTKDLCDKIAAKMISTAGGKWTDADTGLTTESVNPGRALKYDSGSGEVMYFGFVCMMHGSSNYAAEEAVLVTVSTGWDTTNHIPSGTMQFTRIPIANAQIVLAATFARTATVWMWYDADSCTLLLKADSTSANDCVTLFSIERDTSKEYADGYSNFFVFVDSVGGNYPSKYTKTGGNGAVYWGYYPIAWNLPSAWTPLMSSATYGKYLHPFGTRLPVAGTDLTNVDGSSFNMQEGRNYNNTMWYNPIRAVKSSGNAKVYLGFGKAFNDTDLSFKTPIKTIKTFFAVKDGAGIADGDVINVVVGAETWQYIYKSVASPDGGQLDVAIRYA